MGRAGLRPARPGPQTRQKGNGKTWALARTRGWKGSRRGEGTPPQNETAAENRRGQDRNRSFFDALAQIVQGKAQFRVFFQVGHDLIVGADHGGIVPAAEMLADGL